MHTHSPVWSQTPAPLQCTDGTQSVNRAGGILCCQLRGTTVFEYGIRNRMSLPHQDSGAGDWNVLLEWAYWSIGLPAIKRTLIDRVSPSSPTHNAKPHDLRLHTLARWIVVVIGGTLAAVGRHAESSVAQAQARRLAQAVAGTGLECGAVQAGRVVVEVRSARSERAERSTGDRANAVRATPLSKADLRYTALIV